MYRSFYRSFDIALLDSPSQVSQSNALSRLQQWMGIMERVCLCITKLTV
jgi:hypothetical protein